MDMIPEVGEKKMCACYHYTDEQAAELNLEIFDLCNDQHEGTACTAEATILVVNEDTWEEWNLCEGCAERWTEDQGSVYAKVTQLVDEEVVEG